MATAQVKSKQFESQNLVFSPGTWIQKYATTPQIVKKVPSLLHGAVEPWGSRGDPRLRLATVLVQRGAFAEPLRRRDLEATERQLGPEHRVMLIAVNNLGFVLMQLGKFSEAPLMCCAADTVADGWCLHFVLGKGAGKQQPHFLRSSQNFVIYTEVR